MHRAPLLIIAFLKIAGAVLPAQAQALAPERARELRAVYQRPDTVPFPGDNGYSLPKATLGKMLFFDQRLSGGGNMSCSSCHNPSFGWEMPLARAIGSQNTALPRNAPTVADHAWATSQFWDGHAPTLEAQAAGPIVAATEMNMPLDLLVRKLGAVDGYRRLFAVAFPADGLTAANIMRALATFERTIQSGDSPFDRWVEGDDAAISAAAQRGLDLFNGRARCNLCHTGWRLTDDRFHDAGVPDDDRGRALVTRVGPETEHAFKTPSLRDIAHRAPYMHDGSLPDLPSVLAHYVSGGVERPSRSPSLRPLNLSQDERDDLLAFLDSLTGEVAPVSMPILPN